MTILGRVRSAARLLLTGILGASCVLEVMAQTLIDPLAEERALLNEGRIAQAEAGLHAYLETHATSPDAHFLIGYALFKQQKAQESLAEYTAGAKFRRPVAEDFKVIASDYVLLADFSDADKWYSEAAKEQPDNADTWYLLGRTKFNENIYAGAIDDFERAIRLHPKYVEAENNAGLCWKELNDQSKARTAFETAIAWQGDSPTDAQPFLNLGMLWADSGDSEKALPYLEQAASLSPNNPSVHEELGKVQMALQHLPQAQAELEKAIALSPETSSLHFKLAQILRKEGQSQRAQKEFELCSKLSSTHSSTKTPNPLSIPELQ